MRYRIKKHEYYKNADGKDWIYVFYTVDKKERLFGSWIPIERFSSKEDAIDYLIELKNGGSECEE